MDVFVIISNTIGLFVLVSFIMFITRGIVREEDVRTKGLVYFIVSLSLLMIFAVLFIIDTFVIDYNGEYEINFFPYTVLMVSSLIYVIYGLIMIKKGKRFAKVIKKNLVYTYHEKNEYVYIVYKHGSLIFLSKKNNTAIKYQLRYNEFVDETVSAINKKYLGDNENYTECERIGILTHKGQKKDDVYYCYLAEIDNPLTDSDYTWVTNYDISSLDIPSIDKFIILKCLLKTQFDEEF